MNYEKKYIEALDRAKKLKETCDSLAVIGWCEYIFPELKEPKDEKIKEALVALVKCNERNGYTLLNNVSTSSMLAWLEKQGKTNIQNNKPFKIESDKFYFCIKDYFAGGCYRSRKGDIVLAKNGMNMMGLSPKEASEYFIPINPFKEHVVVDWFEKVREKPQGKSALEARQETVDIAKKIKPKFDIGDWITCPKFLPVPSILQVIDFKDGLYELEDIYGTKKRSTISDIESIYDHWTFTDDVKEGDILYYKDFDCVRTFIHKSGKYYYCCIVNDIFIPNSDYFVVPNDNLSRIRPATKEQRDYLFARITEEGYRWDADRKLLIKL